MEEEVKQEVDNISYIDEINKLKQNSVSKEQYDKVIEENRKLLDTIVNGTEKQAPTIEKTVDVNQLRKELYGDDSDQLTNLQYVQKTLELRDAIISDGGKDPFLPHGQRIDATDEDVEKANKVAQVFKECIEFANGDSELFTNELMRRTSDSSPLVRKKR